MGLRDWPRGIARHGGQQCRRAALTTISEADYEAIEAAVMETARGRWFLAEYARRNRNADTQVLLDALEPPRAGGRRRASAPGRRPPPLRPGRDGEGDRAHEDRDRRDAARPITAQPASSWPPKRSTRSRARPSARPPTSSPAAEQIQETAWTLREEGADADALRRARPPRDRDLHGLLVPGPDRASASPRSSRRCAISKAASTR